MSGKVYIGSSENVERRLYIHRRLLTRGEHHSRALQRAWVKHGPDAFTFETVEQVAIPELLEREQFWIDHHGSAIGRGYNGCPVTGTRRGSKQPASYGARMREVHAGKPKSAEQRARMSAAAKGRKNTPEQNAKIAAAVRARFTDPVERAKAVEYGKMGGRNSRAHPNRESP